VKCLPSKYQITCSDTWLCPKCLIEIFPYNHIENNFEFHVAIGSNLSTLAETSSVCFKPFCATDNKFIINSQDIDADNNFYKDLSLADSNYMTARELSNSTNVSPNDLSILHVNCRSLNKNYDNLLQLIQQLNFTVPVIAVTETWTTKATENDFNMPGYVFTGKSRKHNNYGGVGLYILNNIDFKVRPDLTFDVIRLFDSVFIELKQSKIVVGCIYKPPDSNVAEYTYVFDNLLSVVNSHKELCYVAGDFHIDLFKNGVTHTYCRFC